MAELVEYRMECALPQYEQMQALNLFTHEEILYVLSIIPVHALIILK